MKKSMKRILILIMIFVLLLSLAACGGKPKESSNPQNPKNFKLGDHELNIKEVFLMKDEGKDIIVLKMDYTNHSKEPTSYIMGIGPDAMQKDQELEGGVIFLSEDSYETNVDGQLEDVEPGETAEIFDAYELNNLEDEVLFKFWTIASDDVKEIKIDPGKLTLKDSLQ